MSLPHPLPCRHPHLSERTSELGLLIHAPGERVGAPPGRCCGDGAPYARRRSLTVTCGLARTAGRAFQVEPGRAVDDRALEPVTAVGTAVLVHVLVRGDDRDLHGVRPAQAFLQAWRDVYRVP